MSGSTTELNLSTAVDADDNADYLTINLANSLRTLDGLFNNVTGHTHGGAHQGGPVAPAAGSITSGMIADGTIVAADIANATITNAKLASDTARANLLTNGGFEIWQRGTGPFTASGWGPDRYYLSIVGTDTLSVSRDAANALVSGYCAACTFVLGTGGGTSNIAQPLKLATEQPNVRGRTVTFSMSVKCGTANAVRLGVSGDGGLVSVFSAFHVGDSQYATLSVSVAVPASATFINLNVLFAASCTAYLDNAMLVVGSVAADYAPLHPADDLARCLRYYETIGGTNGEYLVTGQAYAATNALAPLRFTTRKAVTPTVTFPTGPGGFQCYGAGASPITLTAISGGGITPAGTQISATVASGLVAGNATLIFPNTSLGTVVVEANP